MLRSFFMNIPKEIEESAMVDGANRLTAFISVIIPIMWPGIISTALFTLLLAYSDFLLVRILTQSNWTLTVAISKYAAGEDPGHITLAAAAPSPPPCPSSLWSSSSRASWSKALQPAPSKAEPMSRAHNCLRLD